MSDWDYRVTFDGGSLGNPGKGYGSYLLERRKSPTTYLERVEFECEPLTNNEAEYLTLIQALHRLRDRVSVNRPAYVVEVVGDSQLVLNQVAGTWAANKSTLASLCTAAVGLLNDFAEYRTRWVPRREMVDVFGH